MADLLEKAPTNLENDKAISGDNVAGDGFFQQTIVVRLKRVRLGGDLRTDAYTIKRTEQPYGDDEARRP